MQICILSNKEQEFDMNICIPIVQDEGLQSRISPHFGSAPLFLIVETATGECYSIANEGHRGGPGRRHPLASLAGQDIKCVVVAGMGQGALNKLTRSGIDVFISDKATVEEVIASFKDGALSRMTDGIACEHHQHQHGGRMGRRGRGGCGHGKGRGPGHGQGHGHGGGGGSLPN